MMRNKKEDNTNQTSLILSEEVVYDDDITPFYIYFSASNEEGDRK